MKLFTQLKQTHPILFSVFVAVFSLLGMIVGGLLSGLLSVVVGDDYYTLMLIQELFAIVLITGMAYASKTLYTVTRRGAGLGHSLLVGAYPAVMIGLVAMSMATVGFQSGKPLQSPLQIAIYCLSMLSIGVAEELAFRGIIAETLLAHFGTSHKGIWKATAVSGVIFGVAHITNIVGAEVLGVLVQAAVATVLGMMLATIYFRTGNLWICILLHASLNGASMLESGLFGGGNIAEFVSSFSLMNLTPCLTYGIPVLFLLRPNKQVEIRFWFGDAPEESNNEQEDLL